MADPFLLQRDGKLYLFYETKAAQLGRGQIGVAVSSDGGASFQHLGVALDLPWHLSYPFVFEHGGQVGCTSKVAGQRLVGGEVMERSSSTALQHGRSQGQQLAGPTAAAAAAA